MAFIVTVRNKRIKDSKPYTVQVTENSDVTNQEEAEAHVARVQPYVEIVKDETITEEQPAPANSAPVVKTGTVVIPGK